MNLKFCTAPMMAILFSISAIPSLAQPNDTRLKSAYVGQENRQIKSLSLQDTDDLSNGRGWGFAKAAELNGLPGPKHILEMADQIKLSPAQRDEIESLFKEMKSRAIPLGKELVKFERELDHLFKNKTANQLNLENQLIKIGKVRTKLRNVHLQTHLLSPTILTPHQIAAYNELRGYTGGNKINHHSGKSH